MQYPQTIPIANILIAPDRAAKVLTDPRFSDDSISTLAEKVEKLGTINPIVVSIKEQIAEFEDLGPDDTMVPQYKKIITLVAGHRRLTACKMLGYTELTHASSCHPGVPGYLCPDELPSHTLREIELSENVDRSDITWQERMVSIADLHEIKKRDAALDSEGWTQEETGKALGYSRGMVAYALILRDAIKANNSEVMAAEGPVQALAVLAGQKQKASEIVAQQLSAHKIATEPARVEVIGGAVAIVSKDPVYEAALRCYNAKFEDWAANQPDGSFNHIITDPPYAIDMAMLEQEGVGMKVGEVARTHDVVSNQMDMVRWVKESYRLLDKHGFCVMWTDQMTWNWMYNIAIDAGFAVQRWPITWVKTSACQNGSAQYNFTKRTEIAMVMRKSGATLADMSKSSSNVWVGSASDEQAKFGHPFAKPLALHKFLFDAICIKGQTVLDPFAGRGTLAYAAIEWGLQPTSIEVEKDLHFGYLENNIREAYRKVLGPNTVFKL